MTEPYWLNEKEIIAVHGDILAESGVVLGILNTGALDSTLQNHKTSTITASKQRPSNNSPPPMAMD